MYSSSHKIKGLEFYPDNNFEFLTYGEQHIAKWTYTSGILNFKELPIERNKQMDSTGLLNRIKEKKIQSSGVDNKKMVT